MDGSARRATIVPRARMRVSRAEIGAAALLFVALAPFVIRLEFFADDFHMGREIARASAESPDVTSAIHDAFVRRWTADFDVFRPLTILTLQLDWWLYGARPGLHHLTNLVLWILAAWMATRAASALCTRPMADLPRAVLLLLLGTSPALVECLGWCVAREDILCGLFGLAALNLQLLAPRRTLLRALCIAGALLAKETAVTLPVLLLWTDLVLCRPDPDGSVPAAWQRFWRALPSFVVLALALAARHALFGRVAGLYLGRPFTDWLGDAELPERLCAGLGSSLLALLAPVSRVARAETALLWIPTLVLALATATGILRALSSPSGRQRCLALLPWILGPLALAAVPLSGVSPDMEKSRLLLLPLCALCMMLAPGLLERERLATRVILLLLLATSFLALLANLRAWSRSSEAIRALRSEAMALAGAGDTLVLEGAVPNPAPGVRTAHRAGLIPELIARDGSYFLSQGLRDFTSPPFAEGPRIILWPPESGVSALVNPATVQRLALARLEMRDGQFTIVARTPGTPEVSGLAVETARCDLTHVEPEIKVHVPEAGGWRLVLIAPEEPVRAESLFGADEAKTATLPLEQLSFVTPGGVSAQLKPDLLRQLGVSTLFAWVEDATRTRRSPVALITLTH